MTTTWIKEAEYRNGNICCFLCEHKNPHNISRVEQENVKTIDELLRQL